MAKILLKNGLPVFRNGALVTVVTDGTGCACCGEGPAVCGPTVPWSITANTASVVYAVSRCAGEPSPIPPTTSSLMSRYQDCPSAQYYDGDAFISLFFDTYSTVWRVYIGRERGPVWKGIKASGNTPIGTYVPDVTAVMGCGDFSEMGGTVVVT